MLLFYHWTERNGLASVVNILVCTHNPPERYFFFFLMYFSIVWSCIDFDGASSRVIYLQDGFLITSKDRDCDPN